MYKTFWLITDETETDTHTTELTYYHFGKAPKFPTRYLEGEPHFYTIEMVWNFKLINKLSIFLKCLFHHCIIKQLSAG